MLYNLVAHTMLTKPQSGLVTASSVSDALKKLCIYLCFLWKYIRSANFLFFYHYLKAIGCDPPLCVQLLLITCQYKKALH